MTNCIEPRHKALSLIEPHHLSNHAMPPNSGHNLNSAMLSSATLCDPSAQNAVSSDDSYTQFDDHAQAAPCSSCSEKGSTQDPAENSETLLGAAFEGTGSTSKATPATSSWGSEPQDLAMISPKAKSFLAPISSGDDGDDEPQRCKLCTIS